MTATGRPATFPTDRPDRGSFPAREAGVAPVPVSAIDLDDPERPFRRLPRALRRWTVSGIWRRVRLPVRRRRWLAAARAALAPYAKAAQPAERGVTAALGDFSGGNGLSRAAVYELARLRAEHPDIVAIDAVEAIRSRRPAARRMLPEIGRLYVLSAPDTYPLILPAIDPAALAGARRIGLWVWETPRLSAEWRAGFDVVHEIWTPSAYSARAIEAETGARNIPVAVRPHAVTPPVEAVPFDRAGADIAAGAFLGLAIMDLRSCPARKNPWAHVAAWLEAFGDDPGRVLVLKLRISKRTACVRDELREMIGGAGNIRMIERDMSEGEIAGLQAAADVYLSLHRAEGYGLNIHELLELGTPVVATDWSANAEYGGAYPHYHPVPWRAVPYRDWTGHYPDGGFTWAEADVRAAAAILRRLAARRGGER